MTPRCLRRADSGMPPEALTPRSDTTSNESSSASPPDRASSETSSGVHSGEEREEVVIRSGSIGARPSPYKPIIKPIPPPIAEEPFGRSTNMRMSSFNINQINHNNNNNNNNTNSHQSLPGSSSMNNNMNSAECPSSSATLPMLRSGSSLVDYHPLRDYPHCSTMPLPGSHQFPFQNRQPAAHQMVAQSRHLNQLNNNNNSNSSANNTPNNSNQSSPAHHSFAPQHTTLPNGVRYANPMLTRRVPHLKNADSPYGVLGLGSGHHTFSKLLHDPLVAAIPEGGDDCLMDSTNYAIISEEFYLTDLTGAVGGGTSNYVSLPPPMDNHTIYSNNNHLRNN